MKALQLFFDRMDAMSIQDIIWLIIIASLILTAIDGYFKFRKHSENKKKTVHLTRHQQHLIRKR